MKYIKLMVILLGIISMSENVWAVHITCPDPSNLIWTPKGKPERQYWQATDNSDWAFIGWVLSINQPSNKDIYLDLSSYFRPRHELQCQYRFRHNDNVFHFSKNPGSQYHNCTTDNHGTFNCT
jgi:hypothetical protein